MAVATPAKWVGKGLTAADPRLIESVADYVALEQYPTREDLNLGIGDRDGFYYKITADLDLSGTARNPLGMLVKTPDGKGGFTSVHTAITIKIDGDGHTITNANWVGGTSFFGGLISWLGAGGSVSNLHISSSSSSSSGYYSGGFVGYNNSGTITACSVTSSSSSGHYSGGFVGYNRSGTITACSVTSSSSSGHYSGGFVGTNSGTITACSVTSSSSPGSYSGGFVGYNNSGTIRNCFAACQVGMIGTRIGFCARVVGSTTFAYNFWDSDYNTTVSATETNATAVTTAQAQAGDTSPINGLSTAIGAAYWYYESGSYPQLTPFIVASGIVYSVIGSGIINSRAIVRGAA